MTTTLKELKSDKTPSTTNIPTGHATAPAVQAIVVNCVSIVDPQLASIIGYELEVVTPALEDSQAACPAHSKVIATSEPRPFCTCIAIVHHVSPASMCGSAPIEVLAATSLTKVVDVLPEKASAICGLRATLLAATSATASSTCTHNHPSVSSVGSMIPEEHPRMTTTLKELKSHETPPTTNIPSGHSTTPTVQAIVVNCVSIVDPQLASIIGYELEVVTAALEDSQAASPAHGKVITTSETRPFAASVAVVHHVFPAGMGCLAPLKVLAPTALTKVEYIFPEKTSTIGDGSATRTPWSLATCTCNRPSVAGIR